jgi:ribosomal protein S18 acetylase RimI-like enzyme
MTALLLHGMHRLRERGASSMVYVTQLANLPAIRAIERLGFTYESAQHTLHGWFDGDVAAADDRETGA